MINHGMVVTKEKIYEKVWGYNSQIEFANIDLYIYYLRKKLGAEIIKNVRGVGYCLKDKFKTNSKENQIKQADLITVSFAYVINIKGGLS